MASSYYEQIPTIIMVVSRLRPRRVLDIGKGFGKYGMLIHEYIGIDNQQKPLPLRQMREQSSVAIDAVDINPDYSLPHLAQIYQKIIIADIRSDYNRFTGYDLVLLIDIIEHLPKDVGLQMVDWFLSQGSHVLVASPRKFYQQEIYGSEAEHHVSHWTVRDFAHRNLNWQNCGPGRVYLLSAQAIRIRGFGSSFRQRARRIARLLISEFGL